MTLTPEVLLFIMERPIGSLLSWAVLCWFLTNSFLLSFVIFALTPILGVTSIITFLFVGSRLATNGDTLSKPYHDWITLKDAQIKEQWAGKKLPMREAYEWYFRDKIDFTRPTLEIFLHRFELFHMVFTMGHLHEIVWGVLGKAIFKHHVNGDADEVTPVYNLGNGFYHSFLADPMLYSCGIAFDSTDSLEIAQARKCELTCEILDLKDGDRVLDFGCGWGSWLIHCAKKFKNVECVGMTISTSQFQWANRRVKEEGLEDRVKILLQDYRDIQPETFHTFDKITCFEMSEHVGIRNYPSFMEQVKSLLKPDGFFFLQIAGLRRHWKYEDLVWGIFMGKYIFPGADASCPLNWDIHQLERGGFEVQTVRNQGVMYAHTIEKWYENLVKNKTEVLKEYGTFAYRLHELFLAWSTMIARQGSSTVWCIVSTHQHGIDSYSVPADSREGQLVKLNRTTQFIRKDRFGSA